MDPAKHWAIGKCWEGGKVLVMDILTVNGESPAGVIPGDITTVKEQSDSVAGAIILWKSLIVQAGKKPLAATPANQDTD